MDAVGPSIEATLRRFRRQYLQLVDVEQLDLPEPRVLKGPAEQSWLFDHLFAEAAGQYRPPPRYRFRVLKRVVSLIEAAVEDPEEDEISDDLMSSLSALLSSRLPAEAIAAQQKSYVTYTFASPRLVSPPSGEPSVTLLESRSVIASGGTTGLRTWEAALHLGAFLCSPPGRAAVSGRRVIELGAGTGLVGILCAKHLGAKRVVATDGDAGVAEALHSNILLNHLGAGDGMRACRLPWGRPLSDLLAGDCENECFDVALGADVTYDKSAIPALVSTLRGLFEEFSLSTALVSATVRNADTFEAFQSACDGSNLRTELVTFEAAPMKAQDGPFYPVGTPIRIVRIRHGGGLSRG